MLFAITMSRNPILVTEVDYTFFAYCTLTSVENRAVMRAQEGRHRNFFEQKELTFSL